MLSSTLTANVSQSHSHVDDVSVLCQSYKCHSNSAVRLSLVHTSRLSLSTMLLFRLCVKTGTNAKLSEVLSRILTVTCCGYWCNIWDGLVGGRWVESVVPDSFRLCDELSPSRTSLKLSREETNKISFLILVRTSVCWKFTRWKSIDWFVETLMCRNELTYHQNL